MLRGCRHTAAVNPPSQRQHTCNLSDFTVADGKREERGGAAIGRSEGGDVADRQRDKGRLSEKSERESSWKMADSFLVQEGGSHWSEGDTVPFPAPPGADTSRLRKVILLFPLSQLTACHSPISSLTLSVSGGLYPFRTFIGIDRDKPSYSITVSANVVHNYSDLKSLSALWKYRLAALLHVPVLISMRARS